MEENFVLTFPSGAFVSARKIPFPGKGDLVRRDTVRIYIMVTDSNLFLRLERTAFGAGAEALIEIDGAAAHWNAGYPMLASRLQIQCPVMCNVLLMRPQPRPLSSLTRRVC